ncbi:MAG: peptide deformylase [Candidatus Aminicenantes bacterium]|nr:peptide deformylase [Candidatus Aminicenantes bacterium]
MARREIMKIGAEILARKAAPVEAIDNGIKTLAQDMVETMHAAPGIGLAAPQVDSAVRLITVDLSVGEKLEDLYILVNPEITAQEGSCVREEGCLSVPEVWEKVTRPQKVTVRALDLEGREQIVEAEDLLARALCHEIDHLNGTLFVDRLSPLKRSLIRKKFKKAAAKKA